MDLHPRVWDHGKAIVKRYNMSDHKVLGRSQAWFLWRIIHPLHSERVERILATGAFLNEALDKKEKSMQEKTYTKQQVEDILDYYRCHLEQSFDGLMENPATTNTVMAPQQWLEMSTTKQVINNCIDAGAQKSQPLNLDKIKRRK